MRMTIVAAAIAALAAGTAQAQAQKFTWDGLGSGRESKCGIYRMHIEFTVQNGHAVGSFQQKDRPLRSFDLPIGADGSFAGQVAVSGGTMGVKGKVGNAPEIKLTGYCDFGGPVKPA